MILTEMISDVRTAVHELTSGFLKDEEIVVYLNKGLDDCLSIISETFLPKICKQKQMDVESSINEYSLPKDILGIKIQTIKIKSGTDWYNLEVRDIKDEADLLNLGGGDPYFFIQFGNKFKIYPTPTNTVVNGLEISYPFNVYDFQVPLGSVSSLFGRTTAYLNQFENTYSDGSTKININDYITFTSYDTGDPLYHARIKSYEPTEYQIQIYTGVSGLTPSIVNLSDNYIEFSSTPDLSNIVFGDTLTVAGSTGNDGDYVIIGIDATNYRIYVRENLLSAVADGTVNITLPDTKGELDVITDLRVLDKNDLITSYGKSGASRLDDVHNGYIVQYAVVEALKQAKEPIQEEMVTLQRMANIVQNYPAARKTTSMFRLRRDPSGSRQI